MTIPKYDIRISADQRELLITALTYVLAHPTALGAEPADIHELQMLHGMFSDLPSEQVDTTYDMTA